MVPRKICSTPLWLWRRSPRKDVTFMQLRIYSPALFLAVYRGIWTDQTLRECRRNQETQTGRVCYATLNWRKNANGKLETSYTVSRFYSSVSSFIFFYILLRAPFTRLFLPEISVYDSCSRITRNCELIIVLPVLIVLSQLEEKFSFTEVV